MKVHLRHIVLASSLAIILSSCESKDRPTGVETNEPPGVTYLNQFASEDEIATWTSPRKDIRGRISGGRLFLTGDTPFIGELLAQTTFSDGIIAVTSEWISGVTDFAYGISFRRNPEGGYAFGLSANGQFAVYKYSHGIDYGYGVATVLAGPTSHTSIAKGGINALGVEMEGKQFRFTINGTVITELSDSTYSEGGVGVFVGGDQEVAFDNFSVTIPAFPLPKSVIVGL